MANPTFDIAIPARSRPWQFGLPVWLVLICVITFSVLLGAGAAIAKFAPPQPATVQSPQQEVLFTAEDIQNGQITYLGRGGQHIGSIWGHGSYLAPDWTADVLHRWGLATAGILYANDPTFSQADLESLSPTEQAVLKAQVREQFKPNRYDPDTGTLLLTAAQTQGLKQVFTDYQELLAHGSVIHSIPDGWFKSEKDIHDVTSFFA